MDACFSVFEMCIIATPYLGKYVHAEVLNCLK